MSSGSDRERLLAGVERLYTDNLAEHGAVPQAVGWRDDATQRLRFEKLVTVVDDRSAPTTVADLGCGYGAMFEYLDEALPVLTEYVGYEISAEMLATASVTVTDARARFCHTSEPTTEVDYSFVSGTFNVKLDASHDVWEAYVRDALRSLARTSRRGVAFNVLSSYVDWREPHLYYADPRAWFDFCRRELSPRVALLHDYPLYEWTMIVRLR